MRPVCGLKLCAGIAALIAPVAGAVSGAMAQPPAAPPFGDTVGTVFDIIRADDPTSFQCLEPKGQGKRQIWDKRVDGEPVVEAYLFEARFSDGTRIEMAINPEFGSPDAARTEAMRYARLSDDCRHRCAAG